MLNTVTKLEVLSTTETLKKVYRDKQYRERLDRKSSIALWRVIKEFENLNPCQAEGCNGFMFYIGDQSAMGNDFEIHECTVCKQRDVIDITPPPPTCGNCGEVLPVVDADYNGLSYGQCRGKGKDGRPCHGWIADVYNPQPDVFYG